MTDFVYISTEDKVFIVSERLRNLENTLYNLEAGLIEENARENVISENVDYINNEISETNRCISALQIELNSLT
jgi:hypothetical protein